MNSQGAGGDDEDDEDYDDGDSTDGDYNGEDEDYDGEDGDDEGDSSASANGRPPLEGKSEAYLRGFREALEKIKRGEIDIDNWAGFMTESADFNFNATLAYRTKGALGKKNRPQEGAAQTPQAPTQPQSTATMASSGTAFGPEAAQSPAEEKADYNKGFADAIKAMKDAIKNKKKQHKQNSGNNMPDMPDMSDVLGGDNNDGSDGDEENNDSNGNGGSNNSEDDDIQDDTSGTGTGNMGEDMPNTEDDSNDVDKTISGEGMEADSYDDDGFEPDDMISKEEA